MKTIYKYSFDFADIVYLEMPKGAKVLSIQMQEYTPTIWALVDTDNEMEARRFQGYKTGVRLDEFAITGRHLGTVQYKGYVYHVFENENYSN